MNRETFKTQLSELFPGETLNLLWARSENGAMIAIRRELTRLEIGHLFSLGLKHIKPCFNGLYLKFNLDKASLNNYYQPQIVK
jgi:hypothetical protein